MPLRHFFLIAFVCLFHANLALADCDPMASLNDKARDFRLARKFSEAQKVVDEVLDQNHDDFRATYTEALMEIDQAGRNTKKFAAGLSKLRMAADLLEHEDQACAKEKNYYSIYDTLGAAYFNFGDLGSAKKYLELALDHHEQLNSITLGKLLDNLGLVAYRQKNYVCAVAWFQKADEAGARYAADHLRLARKIVSSASDTRKCAETDRLRGYSSK
jgi:tetratricopeptide (TPR) repeat protein